MFPASAAAAGKRSALAVLGGLFISLLVLILGLNCYVLCKSIQVNNILDTRYEYFYQYKYPDGAAAGGRYPGLCGSPEPGSAGV